VRVKCLWRAAVTAPCCACQCVCVCERERDREGGGGGEGGGEGFLERGGESGVLQG